MENVRFVDEFFKTKLPKIKVYPPQASFLVWLDCRDLKLSQEELVHLFQDKAGLLLNDGSMFGPGGEGYMQPQRRLSALCIGYRPECFEESDRQEISIQKYVESRFFPATAFDHIFLSFYPCHFHRFFFYIQFMSQIIIADNHV